MSHVTCVSCMTDLPSCNHHNIALQSDPRGKVIFLCLGMIQLALCSYPHTHTNGDPKQVLADTRGISFQVM